MIVPDKLRCNFPYFEEEMKDEIQTGKPHDSQPKPRGTGATVGEQVMADIDKRNQIGEQRYGERLRAFNGRNALQDAYEEALDLSQYLKQALIEQQHGPILTQALILARKIIVSHSVYYSSKHVFEVLSALEEINVALETVGVQRVERNELASSLGTHDVFDSRVVDPSVGGIPRTSVVRPSRGYATGVVLPDEEQRD